MVNIGGPAMRCELIIVFDAQRRLEIPVQAELTSDRAAQARRWLERAWERLGCEPLRPSGKVLLADKVLGVAAAYGYAGLQADAALAGEFAQQVILALERPRVTVDVPGLSLAY